MHPARRLATARPQMVLIWIAQSSQESGARSAWSLNEGHTSHVQSSKKFQKLIYYVLLHQLLLAVRIPKRASASHRIASHHITTQYSTVQHSTAPHRTVPHRTSPITSSPIAISIYTSIAISTITHH
ncbi:hypothetical protein B7494_g8599 [Chlorociboria aeruginascens]|nr:hypothetical protein B7494_g8599 [Chlorociboria aeruginascens]